MNIVFCLLLNNNAHQKWVEIRHDFVSYTSILAQKKTKTIKKGRSNSMPFFSWTRGIRNAFSVSSVSILVIASILPTNPAHGAMKFYRLHGFGKIHN
jgi:hypothetical protein